MSTKPFSIITDIEENEWDYAEAYFRSHSKEIKIKEDGVNIHHSFLNINGKVYAVKVGDALGEGAFGKVRIVQDREGNNYAVKISGVESRNLILEKARNDYAGIEQGEEAIKGIMETYDLAKKLEASERKIMKKIGYLQGYAQRAVPEGKKFKGKDVVAKSYIVQTLHAGDELQKQLTGLHQPSLPGQDLTETQKLILAIKSCQQIQLLHENGIVHADIKPQNFMSDVNGNQIIVRAIDFGLSCRLKDGEESVTLLSSKGRPIIFGTFNYIASEIHLEGKYSFASDVFSLGYMLQTDFNLKSMPGVSDDLKNMIDVMNSNDAKDRPQLKEVIHALKSELAARPDLDNYAHDTIALDLIQNRNLQYFRDSKGKEALLGALRNLETLYILISEHAEQPIVSDEILHRIENVNSRINTCLFNNLKSSPYKNPQELLRLIEYALNLSTDINKVVNDLPDAQKATVSHYNKYLLKNLQSTAQAITIPRGSRIRSRLFNTFFKQDSTKTNTSNQENMASSVQVSQSIPQSSISTEIVQEPKDRKRKLSTSRKTDVDKHSEDRRSNPLLLGGGLSSHSTFYESTVKRIRADTDPQARNNPLLLGGDLTTASGFFDSLHKEVGSQDPETTLKSKKSPR